MVRAPDWVGTLVGRHPVWLAPDGGGTLHRGLRHQSACSVRAMAEGFDPDAQLEKTYLAGPTAKTPRRLRLRSLFAVILLILVGGVAGYFWHQQQWWPSEDESTAEVTGLQPAQQAWCDVVGMHGAGGGALALDGA